MNPWLVSALVVVAIPAAGLLVLRRYFSVVRVRGASMTPAFRPGETLLVRNKPGDRIRVGAVVILRAPDLGPLSDLRGKWLIKRISALPGDAVPESAREATGGTPVVPGGMFTVSADNPDGTDSRRMGFLLIEQISGLVLRKLGASDSPVN